jgi:N-acetylneuraminic acid mutarotase
MDIKTSSTDRDYACVASGGKIYVLGGVRSSGSSYDFTGVNTVEVYDTNSGTWTQLATMPTRRWGHSATVVNGLIYVFGGVSFGAQSQVYSSVEVYDPRMNTWTTKSPMPTKRYCLSTCLMGGNIYAIGGWLHSSNGPLYDNVEVYHPEYWAHSPPCQLRGQYQPVCPGGRIYGGERERHIPILHWNGTNLRVRSVWRAHHVRPTPWATPLITARRESTCPCRGVAGAPSGSER